MMVGKQPHNGLRTVQNTTNRANQYAEYLFSHISWALVMSTLKENI